MITTNDIRFYWNHFLTYRREGSFSQFTVKYPYCVRKCKFCRYPTLTGNDFDDFYSHMINQVDLYAPIFKDFKFGNLKFVGGTPNLMKQEQLCKTMDLINSKFAFHDDIVRSIEIDPTFLTKEQIDLFSYLGFNKILIGFQSSNTCLMKNMNRDVTYDINNLKTLMQYAHSKNITVCIDLLYGLYNTIEENDIKIQEEIDNMLQYADVIYNYQWGGLPEHNYSNCHISREHFYSLPLNREGFDKIFVGETIKLVSKNVKRKKYYTSTSCRGGESNLGLGNYVFSKIHTIPCAYKYINGLYEPEFLSESETHLCNTFKTINDSDLEKEYNNFNFTNGF